MLISKGEGRERIKAGEGKRGEGGGRAGGRGGREGGERRKRKRRKKEGGREGDKCTEVTHLFHVSCDSYLKPHTATIL